MLPTLRMWASGGVEATRWRQIIIGNATALYFASIIGPLVLAGVVLDKTRLPIWAKLPIIGVIGVGAYFAAPYIGQTSKPF